MKKTLLLLISLGFIHIINSQTKNLKEYYYNTDGEEISKQKFKDTNDKFIIKKLVENDSAVIGYQKFRIKKGNLKLNDKKNLYRLLSQTVNEPVDTSKNVLIHFYFNPCKEEIETEFSDKDYRNTLKKFPNVKSYFITEREYRYNSKKIKIFEDKYDFLREVFNDHLFCSNYLIIKPNGDFVIIHGKSKLSLVLDFAV